MDHWAAHSLLLQLSVHLLILASCLVYLQHTLSVCLFFVAFQCISGMSHRNNRTVRPYCPHRHIVQNNGQLNKIKQSTLTLVEKDNLDHMLLNHSSPAAQKGWRIPISLLPWDRSLFYIDQRADWKLLSVRLHARQGHGLKPLKCITYCPLTWLIDCYN